MAHIQHRSGRRPWQVRYRDPTGKERAKGFSRKADADRFAVTVEADKLRGGWTDPRLSKTTVAEWSDRWLRTKSGLKPKTLAGYESNLRAHVLPAFKVYELRQIDRMAVEERVADLQGRDLGTSAVRQARQVLNSMMALAVEAGYLIANPVTGVSPTRGHDQQARSQPERAGSNRFLVTASRRRTRSTLRSQLHHSSTIEPQLIMTVGTRRDPSR